MISSDDNWPLPKYNPGSSKHLHALGVIAVTYAGFQRSVDNLYAFHPRQQKMPDELIDLYYFTLSEDKRIDAVHSVFKTYEKDDDVVAAVKNVLDYFKWCKRTRDQILHAERYPASFGGDPDTLYLIKRVGRRSAKSGHMALKLNELRSIADKMRVGIVQSASIHIHLRVRDTPIDKIELGLRPYKDKSLPQALNIPAHLKLSATP